MIAVRYWLRLSMPCVAKQVKVSDQRELVLNLVRLRYSDAPEFLAINGISTQMNFQASASIGGDFGEVEDSDSAFVSPGAAVGYSETPTITFTPQRDQAFTRQLISPVELDSVYLLTQYGWGIDRVLRLVARDLNGLDNSISRETTATQDTESLRLFADIASRLRHLEEAQLIGIGVEQRREVLSAPIPTDRVATDDLLSAADAGYQFEYLEYPPAYVLSGSHSHYVLRVDGDAWDHDASDGTLVAYAATHKLKVKTCTSGRPRWLAVACCRSKHLSPRLSPWRSTAWLYTSHRAFIRSILRQ